MALTVETFTGDTNPTGFTAMTEQVIFDKRRSAVFPIIIPPIPVRAMVPITTRSAEFSPDCGRTHSAGALEILQRIGRRCRFSGFSTSSLLKVCKFKKNSSVVSSSCQSLMNSKPLRPRSPPPRWCCRDSHDRASLFPWRRYARAQGAGPYPA